MWTVLAILLPLVTLHLSSAASLSAHSRKWMCRFGLNTHCPTEALDRAVSALNYLKSPHSPGRRQRHASLIKALQQQKVNDAAGNEGSEDSVAEVRRKREAETEEEAPASAAAGDPAAAATAHGDAALRRRGSLKAVNVGDALYETAPPTMR